MTDGSATAADLAALVAAAPRPWLVATDVDGTLAEITSRPDQSRLVPGALAALDDLSDLIGITVAVVSGRSLSELVDQFGFPHHLQLVGSHGVEHRGSRRRTPAEADVLSRLRHALGDVAAVTPGAHVETKPFAVALHVRNAGTDDQRRAIEDAHRAIEAFRGESGAEVTVHDGKLVVEVAVRRATKAAALARLHDLVRPATTVFIGDDDSDETAFAALSPSDVGVKVGDGPTAASHRLAGPTDVVAFLRALASSGDGGDDDDDD